MGEKSFTAKEICKILNISRATLWRLVKRGVINPTRLSARLVRFSFEEVQRVMEANSRNHISKLAETDAPFKMDNVIAFIVDRR
jgi:excisionase family DNA binding protein